MISISGLNYSLNSNPILEEINLDIADGEFVAVIGPNGAGKSTLIKLILGLLPLQTGSITIDGTPHLDWLRNNPIGYLPQHEEFDRHFPATARDIVLMGLAGELRLGGRFSAEHKRRAREALAKTKVEHLAAKLVGNLSGGELQRVYLARALVTNSQYLILDEPEASVDSPGVDSFFLLLKELNKEGQTVVTISHDLNMLTQYCSFLVCLNRSLHCHDHTEMVHSETIHKTFGDTVRIIEKKY